MLVMLLLIVVGCQEKSEIQSEIYPICSSEFCSANGAKELIDLYQKGAMSGEILTFKVNCIVATKKKPDFFKIKQTIDELNTVFVHAKINFVVHSAIHYSPTKLNIDIIAEKDGLFTLFKEDLKKRKSINIIILPHGQKLNGYTLVLPENFLNYLNLGYETMYISDKAWFNKSTLAHELGHFFGLQHTFGKVTSENATLEKPDGTNCIGEGDFICDTPADPNGRTDKNCNYTGKYAKNGVQFKPQVSNYMSYYPNSCKNEFTKGQYNAMNFFAKEYRSYLIY